MINDKKCCIEGCNRIAKIEIDGKSYCYTHDPNLIEDKKELKDKKCCESILDGFHNRLCNKPAKVKINGKYYCGIHDLRKRDKLEDKWEKEKRNKEEKIKIKEEKMVLNHPFYKELEDKYNKLKKKYNKLSKALIKK